MTWHWLRHVIGWAPAVVLRETPAYLVVRCPQCGRVTLLGRF